MIIVDFISDGDISEAFVKSATISNLPLARVHLPMYLPVALPVAQRNPACSSNVARADSPGRYCAPGLSYKAYRPLQSFELRHSPSQIRTT
jgi:hypothetical protein